MNLIKNTLDIKKYNNIVHSNELLDFMAGSAMIFSGFAITANDMKDQIVRLENTVSKLVSDYTIEWVPISIIAKKVGLGKSAVNKRLHNGDFEEGVDFKRDGNTIIVRQGAIGRLQRQRRSHNG